MDNEILSRITDVLTSLDNRIHKLDLAVHWIATQKGLGHIVDAGEHLYCQELIKQLQISINERSGLNG